MTLSLARRRPNLQITYRGPPLACLLGTRCAESMSLIGTLVPKALNRLTHKELVGCADSRRFSHSTLGNPTTWSTFAYSRLTVFDRASISALKAWFSFFRIAIDSGMFEMR